MSYNPRTTVLKSKDTREVARDLRAFAEAGVLPGYAAKLLAVAAELDVMAANSNAAQVAAAE